MIGENEARIEKAPMNITHDFTLSIATGKSRKDISWKNKTWQWSALLDKIAETHRTVETHAEYVASKKDRQDEIKDVGGFVGGYLTGGRRKGGSVSERQLVTLDIDNGYTEFWEDFQMLYDGFAAALYTTHKHCPDKPRYRLLMPLDREVKTDEYEAIARRIAGNLGIQYFDDTTFQPERLMYWPSTSKDGEYVFLYQDGPAISADEILATYRKWQDISEWPVSPRQTDRMAARAKKQGDPHDKPGIVGAFCRTYDIHAAIVEYLGDVYEECAGGDRYTYTHGSCAGGLVLYDGGKFAFSNHNTDPASGKLCNAFDLVRLHLYGLQDENTSSDTPINKRPSYMSMLKLARKDGKVSQKIGEDRDEEAKADFPEAFVTDAEGEPDDDGNNEWRKKIKRDKNGAPLDSMHNFMLILNSDPRLKSAFAYDEFHQQAIITRSLPWRSIKKGKYFTDDDEAGLASYLERRHNLRINKMRQDVAFRNILLANRIHPILEYLKGLTWDGTARVDTLFIDYLGAEDTPLNRAMTRKAIVAMAARIMEPGKKFDPCLVLVGRQNIGKSSILRKLAGPWYKDQLTVKMMADDPKRAAEQLQGGWIVEVGEMSGMRKADIAAVKQFLSTQEDSFRPAYGRQIAYFPRQGIIAGTTNDPNFLRNDANGNRKFWPIIVGVRPVAKDIHNDLTQLEVDQILAEAVHLFNSGEDLYLNASLEAEANQVQADHTEKDEREGAIVEFLDMLLPEAWATWNIDEQKSWLTGGDIREAGTVQRAAVCIAEIWCVLFNRQMGEMTAYNTKGLHSLMRGLPGWEKASGQRTFKNYGRQLYYKRLDA